MLVLSYSLIISRLGLLLAQASACAKLLQYWIALFHYSQFFKSPQSILLKISMQFTNFMWKHKRTLALSGVAEILHCLMNRRIRDPHVRWC